MPFRAKRRDANEREIVAALESAGASVQRLDAAGVPDLLVGFRGETFLIEVKNPESTKGALAGGVRRKGRGCLTPDQVAWFGAWRGGRIHEVVNIHEALAAIGALT